MLVSDLHDDPGGQEPARTRSSTATSGRHPAEGRAAERRPGRRRVLRQPDADGAPGSRPGRRAASEATDVSGIRTGAGGVPVSAGAPRRRRRRALAAVTSSGRHGSAGASSETAAPASHSPARFARSRRSSPPISSAAGPTSAQGDARSARPARPRAGAPTLLPFDPAERLLAADTDLDFRRAAQAFEAVSAAGRGFDNWAYGGRVEARSRRTCRDLAQRAASELGRRQHARHPCVRGLAARRREHAAPGRPACRRLPGRRPCRPVQRRRRSSTSSSCCTGSSRTARGGAERQPGGPSPAAAGRAAASGHAATDGRLARLPDPVGALAALAVVAPLARSPLASQEGAAGAARARARPAAREPGWRTRSASWPRSRSSASPPLQPAIRTTTGAARGTDAEAVYVVDTSRSMLAVVAARTYAHRTGARGGGAAAAGSWPNPLRRSDAHRPRAADCFRFPASMSSSDDEASRSRREPSTSKRDDDATSLGALAVLGTQEFFSPSARRRLVVVFTDGESRPYDVGNVSDALRRGRA